jgi:hypothetical protein
MASKTKPIRCAGCGDVLDAGASDVVQVSQGNLTATKTKRPRFVKEGDPWGHMHVRCFKIAIGDPDAVDVLATPA